MAKGDLDTSEKRFGDFEILPKFSEIHVFGGTIRHPSVDMSVRKSGLIQHRKKMLIYAPFGMVLTHLANRLKQVLKNIWGLCRDMQCISEYICLDLLKRG